MQDRYIKKASLPKNLYATGAPLLIAAGALLYDRVQNKNLVQLKFQNLSSSNIRSVTVELSFIENKNSVTQTISHQYTDISSDYENEFGSKEPIYLSATNVDSFDAKITEIIFSSGRVWQNKELSWEPLKQQPPLSLETPELEDHYRLHFGQQCRYTFMKQKDLWFCPCGKINAENKCPSCGLSLAHLENFDLNILNREMVERSIHRQKSMRILKICMIAIVPLAILITCLVQNFSPQKRYDKAKMLMEEGYYEEAAEIFEGLGEYSNAADLAKSARELDQYN